MKFIFIYVTNSSKEEAGHIADVLLQKRLVACANIYDAVESRYHWQGQMRIEQEAIMILKTLEKNFEPVKKEIEKIHSYTIPCIVKIPVTSNRKYFDWVVNEVTAKST